MKIKDVIKSVLVLGVFLTLLTTVLLCGSCTQNGASDAQTFEFESEQKDVGGKPGVAFVLENSIHSIGKGSISYQWYRTFNKKANGAAMDEAVSKKKMLSLKFTDEGKYYYYCVVTKKNNALPAERRIQQITSRVITVDVNRYGYDWTPELPRVWVKTSFDRPAGNVFKPKTSDDFQQALDEAKLGDVIELAAGTEYVGNFKLPNKTEGDGWIYIITSEYDRLPPPGVRVDPVKHAQYMPKLVTPNVSAAIENRISAHHYRFVGIDISTSFDSPAPQRYINYGIVMLTPAPNNVIAGHVEMLASYITFDRCYVHGHPEGNSTGGIKMNGRNIAVIDSYVSEIHCEGADAQAVGSGRGPGPYKIVNNYLEGSGENVMFGGADAFDETFQPQDIEFRNNHLYTPLLWRTPRYFEDGTSKYLWVIKNSFELKNTKRILIDGNIFENNWGGQGQGGPSILFTVRNQSGYNSWASITDVTFTNNLLLNFQAGINILTTDYSYESDYTRTILFRNNIIHLTGPGGTAFLISGPGSEKFRIDHNTMIRAANSFFGINPKMVLNDFAFTNNIVDYARYGFHIDAGGGVLSNIIPDGDIYNNLLYSSIISDPKWQYGLDASELTNVVENNQADIGFAGAKSYLMPDHTFLNAYNVSYFSADHADNPLDFDVAAFVRNFGLRDDSKYKDMGVGIVVDELLYALGGKYDYPIVKKASADATLSLLRVGSGVPWSTPFELKPAFNPYMFQYEVTLDDSVDNLIITTMANNGPAATVSGAGKKTLAQGKNTFVVKVTAADGRTTLAYTITVR